MKKLTILIVLLIVVGNHNMLNFLKHIQEKATEVVPEETEQPAEAETPIKPLSGQVNA